ncbi:MULTISPECIES: hypothetical protein [Haloferax]|uniref:Uncharacterized protein n=6 Tax=Haloferax TaxID=2251 RepID=A0A384LMS8_HALVD|nr:MULTISPECIES: hypothetical protein [Haloferax]MBC9986385.1 hypothetical protein [Haloferax sp. AS1]ADE02548.1 uncharacterized protein HVO_1642 [Haloferax volcanii DS2]ELK51285.1 hypothetical protein D320_15565 [Haloferax sp. BAB-2207]ELY35656.1 hypothetical protein C498_03570 [Haloferax volcanii DS2]ELZ74454.1 hypothetical protein C456_08803 [Haloferax lucentense DSM 14919]
MSEQPSNTEPSLGLVVQTIFVLAVVIGIPSVFALGGRLRFLALAAVSILLLAGFLVVGYRHARRRKSLHQHVAFLVVWFGGIVLADRLARVASGRLPEPGPYLVAVGVTLGALWLGSRLAYGGALTQALFGSD